MASLIKLGVNLDHVATLREARGASYPNFQMAIQAAEKGGADGITVHLREDRRHIQPSDVWLVKKTSILPLNLEMSLAPSIVNFALKVKPPKVCLVPEKRRELTTEGGLDVIQEFKRLQRVIPAMKAKGIEVSLFIDPTIKQIEAAKEIKTDFIELHTGTFANKSGKVQEKELERLIRAARLAHELKLGINAGHGLTLENVKFMKRLPYLTELNIGHSIIARSVFVGLTQAVREMKKAVS